MSSSSNMILRSEESYKYKKCHRLYVPSEKNIKQMDFITRSTFNIFGGSFKLHRDQKYLKIYQLGSPLEKIN